MVPTYRLSASVARIYCLDREQPKCVTKGYYIIARSASWGPSVPLGGFRPLGICGCSLGLLKNITACTIGTVKMRQATAMHIPPS